MFATSRCHLTTMLSRSAVQGGKDQTSVTFIGNLFIAPLVILRVWSCKAP
jgi:hypothetical protein